MGFWAGFGEAFQQSYGESLNREERRKIFLDEQKAKRQKALGPLQAKANEGLQGIEEQRAKLRYLEQRGLPEGTINALLEDPDALETAYTFSREGKGADLEAEQLADIFRVSQIQGAGEGQNAFELLDTMADMYTQAQTGQIDDPDSWVDPATAPRPRTAVIETRVPQKEEEDGVTATQKRTWEVQESTYDRNILGIANSRIKVLKRKQDAGEALSTAESEEMNLLVEQAGKYDTDIDYKVQLRDRFGPQAKELVLKEAENMPSGFLAGLQNNPLIYAFGSPEEQTLRQELQQEPTDPNTPIGTRTVDGVIFYVYQNADGSIIQRKTLR